MRETELMVPIFVSIGLMLLMLKAFSVAQLAPQTSSVSSTLPIDVTSDGSDRHEHMHMNGHMRMTVPRMVQPGDQERADQIAELTRKAIEKYADYKLALVDGYKIFLPEVPQAMYHFTNYWHGFKAGFEFDVEHPTSLLYEKTSAGEYKLIGAMFTAPARFTEEQLNERIPLSVAQWHLHTNFCQAPSGQEKDYFGNNSKFGLRGSIVDEKGCTAAGGTFRPAIFGWMVPVYPFEKKKKDVWSVERQMAPAA
jgi:hypothetical protein